MFARKMMFLILISSFFAMGSASPVNARVYVKKAPPAKKVDVRPVKPHKNTVWVSGYWSVKRGNWIWVAGQWQMKRPGYVWIDGHWKNTSKGWIWIKGHWAKK